MPLPSLTFIRHLSFASLPDEVLADYARALNACLGPASTADSPWHREVASLCCEQLACLRREINLRLTANPSSATLSPLPPLFKDLSALEGTDLPANSTHTPADSDPLSRLRFIAWCLEADHEAHLLGLPYTIGQTPDPFNPDDYPDDASLTACIHTITRRADYTARLELIAIADHIQTTITTPGLTADHLLPVNAILSTGMPSFHYPAILKALETTIATLTRTKAKTDLELAPILHTLWTHTMRQTHLNRLLTTLRHCHNTLTKGKTYPGLGLNPADPTTLTAARRLLTAHRRILHLLTGQTPQLSQRHLA